MAMALGAVDSPDNWQPWGRSADLAVLAANRCKPFAGN